MEVTWSLVALIKKIHFLQHKKKYGKLKAKFPFQVKIKFLRMEGDIQYYAKGRIQEFILGGGLIFLKTP